MNSMTFQRKERKTLKLMDRSTSDLKSFYFFKENPPRENKTGFQIPHNVSFLFSLMIIMETKCTQTSANGSFVSQTGRNGAGFEKALGNQGNWVTLMINSYNRDVVLLKVMKLSFHTLQEVYNKFCLLRGTLQW